MKWVSVRTSLNEMCLRSRGRVGEERGKGERSGDAVIPKEGERRLIVCDAEDGGRRIEGPVTYPLQRDTIFYNSSIFSAGWTKPVASKFARSSLGHTLTRRAPSPRPLQLLLVPMGLSQER